MWASAFVPWWDGPIVPGEAVGAPPDDRFVNLAHVARREASRPPAQAMWSVIDEHIPWGPDLLIGQPGAILQHTVRQSLLRGFTLADFDIPAIRDCVAVLAQRIRTEGLRDLGEWDAVDDRRLGDWIPPLEPVSRWDEGLYTRYGLVECRVVESWLGGATALEAAEDQVLASMDDEEWMYQPRSGHWLESGDPVANLRALMTNAGFYLGRSEGGRDQSARWARRYLEALAASDRWFSFTISYPWFMALERRLAEQDRLAPWLVVPSPSEFYQRIAGRRVLFVTAFADGVGELHRSGRIRRLYRTVEVPEFDLVTVQAPLSTWPNRPAGSWEESFNALARASLEAVRQHDCDLVIASCGCYGLPLVHEVHRVTGVASVYLGNYTNTLMGVLQGTSRDFMVDERLEENWHRSELSRVPNMHRIDQGRYV